MLLILREEIVSLVVLLFLLFYYVVNKVKDKNMFFLKISCAALAHVTLDLITVITVNNLDVVPNIINRILHVCFYISGILFAIWIYSYFIRNYARNKYTKALKNLGYALMILYAVMLAVLPMEYVTGNGTNYSFGLLAITGYGIFLLYCTACVIILLSARKQLDRRTKLALTPVFAVMYIAVILQAIIPELLITGGSVTLVCIGLFVALDNPDKDLMAQALWDFSTGLKNKNSYNRDLAVYNDRNFGKKITKIGFLVADMNYLKATNDTYGHAEGDRLLAGAANILKEHLKSAEDVYRLGGDEFAAIYLSPNDNAISHEMEAVLAACSKADGYAFPISIAMGYASGNISDGINVIFSEADKKMYENKLQIKAANPHLSNFR